MMPVSPDDDCLGFSMIGPAGFLNEGAMGGGGDPRVVVRNQKSISCPVNGA